MFTTSNWGALTDGSLLELGASAADFIVIAIGIILMFMVSLLQGKKKIADRLEEKPVALRYIVLLVLILAAVVLGAYGIGYDATQFIYNQF